MQYLDGLTAASAKRGRGLSRRMSRRRQQVEDLYEKVCCVSGWGLCVGIVGEGEVLTENWAVARTCFLSDAIRCGWVAVVQVQGAVAGS